MDELWSLREDVHVETVPGGTLILHSRWGETSVPAASPAEREALRRMSFGPILLENVVRDRDARQALLNRILGRIDHLVVRSFGFSPDPPLLSIVPLAPQARIDPVTVPRDVPVRLSRFTVLRGDGSEYALESPLSLHRVVLHRDEAVWAVASLARPITPDALAAALPESRPGLAELIPPLLSSLVAIGMAVQARAADPPVFAEDTDPVLVPWSPIDLLFHTRSTRGRHDNDFGATRPRGERRSAEPVVKPNAGRPGIPLFRPRWDDLVAADPPLTVAIEARDTVPESGPPSADDLGELLYRTARVRSLTGAPVPEASDRPYQDCGDCYELEIYLTVHECDGILRGCYHYDPLGHALEPLEVTEAEIVELLDNGRITAGLDRPPPVLLTVTARFRRLSWRYEGPGYALIQRNVGSVLQLLGLVGTAMGLPGRPQESSDIELVSRIFRIDWRVESAVGEFVIGIRPPPGPERDAARRDVNDASWGELARSVSPGSEPFIR